MAMIGATMETDIVAGVHLGSMVKARTSSPKPAEARSSRPQKRPDRIRTA
jgi:hypothetical protein